MTSPVRHCEERKRRSNPVFRFAGAVLDCFAEPVIGAHSRDPLAGNDGLKARIKRVSQNCISRRQ
jgi:hypothetical protein